MLTLDSTALSISTPQPSADALGELLDDVGMTITASHVVPGGRPTFAEIPARVSSSTRGFLVAAYPRGLYRHQVLAIDALAGGADVCLETPTASGKSLVFQVAARETLASEGAKVIALYPAKALIEDQLAKWRAALDGTPYAVARIDGTVPVADRMAVAARADVLLMTPDVVHAWMMSRLSEGRMRELLGAVRLLILDEAHVYDGVFGSNTAYFLRRLQVAMNACRPREARPLRLLCATATIGSPAAFVERLTGRTPVVVGAEVDGSPRHAKRILKVAAIGADRFESTVGLLRGLAQGAGGRFLAFADSRRMVEQLCAVIEREDAVEGTVLDRADEDPELPSTALYSLDAAVLPYRAGYEEDDRAAIQRALASGRLRGVVATSALELGIDIGDIDTVVCIGVPPSMKAFWQRAGRAGRRGDATVLIVEADHRPTFDSDAQLAEFLAQPMEPNWLYLDNRYLQYAQALCAARELGDLGLDLSDASLFDSLPAPFQAYVANEMDPREPIAPDLFTLKQRAAASAPEYAFPLRNGLDESLEIHAQRGGRIGELTFPQALREAYPGGVYMHLAKAHRVVGFSLRQNRVDVVRCPYATTRPLLQTMIFPDFGAGVIDARTSDAGFIAEVSLQVSQRLNGFVEIRGRTREEHAYGPGSPHAQRPIGRFFQSTGICWWFGEDASEPVEALATAIVEAGCERFGLHGRDVGFGRFHANRAFGRSGPLRGLCIFDTTWGSLRLTSRFLDELPSILEGLVGRAEPGELRTALATLLARVTECRPIASGPILGLGPTATAPAASMIVIAPGSRGMLMTGSSAEEITVGEVVFTPNGFMYRVEVAGGRRLVAVGAVEPVHGVSRMQRFDPTTYESEDVGRAGE